MSKIATRRAVTRDETAETYSLLFCTIQHCYACSEPITAREARRIVTINGHKEAVHARVCYPQNKDQFKR